MTTLLATPPATSTAAGLPPIRIPTLTDWLGTPSRAEYDTWWAVQAHYQRHTSRRSGGALLPPRQVAQLTREGAVHTWIPGGLTQTQATRCHRYYRRHSVTEPMLPVPAITRQDARQHAAGRIGLPIRPMHVAPGQLDTIRQAARHDRSILPRWQAQTSIIHHTPPPPGVRRGLICWTNMDHWLTQVVPYMLNLHPEVLAHERVSPALFTRWISWWALYADVRTGRNAIWRPIMSHYLGLCSETTDHVCRRAAHKLGLMVTVVAGRMLTRAERDHVRQQGGYQRGLANVVDFVVPAEARHLCSRTPPSGRSVTHKVTSVTQPSSTSGGRKKAAAPRRRTNQQGRRRHTTGPGDPIWDHARVLTTSPTRYNPDKPWIPWLTDVQPGRLVGQLAPYIRAGWTPRQLIDALDHINHRLGYTSPTRSQTHNPLALLAWYLHQIDPIADHPTTSPLVGGRKPAPVPPPERPAGPPTLVA